MGWHLGSVPAVLVRTPLRDSTWMCVPSAGSGSCGALLGFGSLNEHLSVAISRRFKDEQIDILVATDVAARGLDIAGVKTVSRLRLR